MLEASKNEKSDESYVFFIAVKAGIWISGAIKISLPEKLITWASSSNLSSTTHFSSLNSNIPPIYVMQWMKQMSNVTWFTAKHTKFRFLVKFSFAIVLSGKAAASVNLKIWKDSRSRASLCGDSLNDSSQEFDTIGMLILLTITCNALSQHSY